MRAGALLPLFAACNSDYAGLTKRAPPSVSVVAPGPYYERVAIEVEGTVALASGAALRSCAWTWGLGDAEGTEDCDEADEDGGLRWSWTPDSPGGALVTLTATDDGNQSGTASVSFEVLDDQAPSAAIYVPEDGATLYDDEPVTLVGVVYDAETEDLSSLTVRWKLDGVDSWSGAPTSEGETTLQLEIPGEAAHRATLEVTVDGETDSDTVDFSVLACNYDGDAYYAEACGGSDCDDRNAEVTTLTWYADADGDGLGDPTRPYVACEAPDGYVSNPDDCDDTDPAAPSTLYADADGDGHGDPDLTVYGCATAGFVAEGDDCDDADATVSPSATETCDGVDDDCDGTVDQDDAVDALTWYADADGDGFGDATRSGVACAAPAAHVADATDCDDTDATTYPGATETCDGADDDCDGTIDEDDAADVTTWYLDADGDGYGDSGTFDVACDQPASYITTAGDCDDLDADVHPGADETDCTDPTDYNCDGSVAYADTDADGAPACEDCDDADASVTDGYTWYIDADADGYGVPDTTAVSCSEPTGYAATGDDCDDTDAAVNPGAAEPDCADPTDYNCDGSVGYADADGDGTPACEDCDDADGSAYPGATESCDGVDNDCDGTVDEDDATDAGTWYLDADSDGYGDDAISTVSCEGPASYVATGGDCDDGDAAYNPGAPEADCADPHDYNCDGSVAYADADGDGWPACADCDDAAGAVNPGAAESCNGVDDDCDGAADEDFDADGDTTPDCYDTEECDGLDNDGDGDVDEDSAVDALTWYEDGDGDGYGDASTTACDAPGGYVADGGDCDDDDNDVYPTATETCDGVDEDCDGSTDEDASDADTFYADVDGDGLGDAMVILLACTQPSAYVDTATDCDDDDAAVGEASTWYADADGDGYGGSTTATACDPPTGYVATSDDCDDTDPDVSPATTETCNGVDDDCDGETDEDDAADASTWYQDWDGDGYGSEVSSVACNQPSGYVGTSDDCDDGDEDVHPGAAEACNGVDDDCDGSTDEDWGDSDADGTLDCADTEACDGLDNDGDGEVDEGFDDADGDGTADCVDIEECDGLDNDGDGYTDESSAIDALDWYLDADGDGYGTGAALVACDEPAGYTDNAEDCDDGDDTVYPGADDACDGLDNDCDGALEVGEVDADGDGAYACAGEGDCDDADPLVYPGAPELCDGIDNNCNGELGTGELVDSDGDGADACQCAYFADVAACEAVADCDDADADRFPGNAEACDNKDNDCDGALGPEETTDADGDGSAACDDCDDGDGSRSPDFDEVCLNGIDDDCDGVVDWCSAGQADVTIYGEDNTDHVGTGLLVADVDGDGRDDVATNCPGPNTGSVGAVCVFSGTPSSGDTPSSADYIISGTVSGSGLGGTLTAGDLDDDGHADVLAWSVGQAYVIPGPLTSTTALSDAIELDGSMAYSSGALSAGDVDGDGDDDALVGDQQVYTTYLLDGPLSGDVTLSTEADAVLTGSYWGSGMTASNECDVNADGNDDVLVGGYNWYAGTDGGVYLVFGPVSGALSLDTAADVIFEQENSGDGLGSVVECHGDAHGDGYDDILFGLSGVDYIENGGGAVYLVDGRASASWSGVALSSASAVLYGDEYGVGAAAHLADVSGDGTPDVLTAANSDVLVFYGPLSGSYVDTEADAMIDGGGGPQAAADLDADGVPDLVLADANDSTTATYAGAIFVIFGGF